MAGIFSTAQPKYDALRIATFPFDATGEVKRGPLVSHYNRMGLQASRQMALRFRDAPGLAAMAGARNRLTVIDIDECGAAGERLLADVQRQFGGSKVVVRTGSGGFHAYYRHSGEGRKIRPDPRKPIDLIGGGPIVLPPSRGFRGNYEIIDGHVDDLAALEPIRSQSVTASDSALDPRSVIVGERDKKFWPYVAQIAHQARSLDALIEDAMEINNMMLAPLSQPEVAAKCRYWWEKTQKGENRYGIGRDVRIGHALLDDLMMRDPDAFNLLMYLRRHHWGRDFYLANEACSLMPAGGWRRQRFTAARSRLIEQGYLEVVKLATFRPQRPMLLRVSNNGQ